MRSIWAIEFPALFTGNLPPFPKTFHRCTILTIAVQTILSMVKIWFNICLQTWSHSVRNSLVCTTFTLTRSQHNTSRKSQHVISQGRRHSVIATYWRENYQWSSCYFRLISELVGFQLEHRRKNTISSIAQEQKPFPGPHLKNPRRLPATWSYYKGILVSYKHSQNHPNIPVYNWTHRLSLWLYFLCQDCT